MVLATSLTNDNGPNAPLTGYNRAVAADLSLTVSAPVRPPAPITPPPVQVPPYQHVFLFYFENEDYNQIIGNKQAPYINSLLRQGSVLSQFYAEEHPSDGNYLAVAGGSTYGIPLDDPEEENPLYTISAPNIGDLVGSAQESWKAYLQSANGPCDDTVHGYYWNDDQPRPRSMTSSAPAMRGLPPLAPPPMCVCPSQRRPPSRPRPRRRPPTRPGRPRGSRWPGWRITCRGRSHP